jgi:hypothetical protein
MKVMSNQELEDFKKRRNQKNWIVMGVVLSGVALIWIITLIKLQNGM